MVYEQYLGEVILIFLTSIIAISASLYKLTEMVKFIKKPIDNSVSKENISKLD